MLALGKEGRLDEVLTLLECVWCWCKGGWMEGGMALGAVDFMPC